MNTLAELAELIGGTVRGDSSRQVGGISTLDTAGPSELSFFTGAKYREQALASHAGAFLVPQRLAESLGTEVDRDLLETEDLPGALARIVGLFHPAKVPAVGVHSTAVVAEDVHLGVDVSIGAFAVIGPGCVIGDGTVLGDHVSLGDGCVLGARCRLYPQVVLYEGCRLGQRVVIHSGAVVGSDGFGYASSAAGHQKIPQVGHVEIGDDVEIGANSTIDRASLNVTRIGAGTKVDNLVQVGHNVAVGEHCLLVSQSGVAGSTELGRFVVLAGQSGVAGHIKLGDGVKVAAKSAALQTVEAGHDVAGVPAVDLSSWRRQQALVRRLPDLRSRLRSVEKQLRSIGSEKDSKAE